MTGFSHDKKLSHWAPPKQQLSDVHPERAVFISGKFGVRVQVQKCQEWDRWVEAAFAQIDSSGSGALTVEELSRFLCSDGLCLSEDRLRDAVRDAHGAATAGETDELSLQVIQLLYHCHTTVVPLSYHCCTTGQMQM